MEKDENVALYAVSIDPAEKSLELIKKIEKDGKGAVDFRLLSDPEHNTIDAYGLFNPAYAGKDSEGIPYPAVYVLDENQKIVWARVEEDYRKRPTIAEIRAELEKLKKMKN